MRTHVASPSTRRAAVLLVLAAMATACSDCRGTPSPLATLPKKGAAEVRKELPPTFTTPEARRLQAADAFRARFRGSSVTWDPHTGHASDLASFVSPAPAGVTDPEQAARAFLDANAELLGLDARKPQLRLVANGQAVGSGGQPTSRTLRFAQEVGRVPVYQGQVTVMLTPTSSVLAVHSRLAPISKITPAEPRIGREAAFELARKALGARAPAPGLGLQRAEPVIYPLGATGVRGWSVTLGHWLVIVSGEDGETLLLKDEARYADALVFLENEAKDAGATQVKDVPNLGTATTLCGTRFCVTNRVEAGTSAPQQFRAPVADVNFDDQMAYYHLERIASRFNGLGVAGPAAVFPVITRDGAAPCNAFFSPAELSIHVGTPADGCDGSCRAPGQFADILYHEFTHHVLDQEVGLNYDETESGAIHEGTSDYFAGSALGNACMAEQFSGAACMRDAAAFRKYPRDMDTESHKGGEVWASALWSLRSKLGSDVAERVVRQGLVGLPADADFQTFAANIVTQGTAYYANFLGDDGWKNFFLLLVMASVVEGSQQAFCEHGIAVPYGAWVDLDLQIPEKDTERSWSVTVPPGQKVDRGRGCLGGYDLLATGGWQDLKYFEENRGSLSRYQVDVTDSGLTVTMKTPGGCADYQRVRLRYRLYTKSITD